MDLELAVKMAGELQCLYDQEISVYVFSTGETLATAPHPNLDLGIPVGKPMSELHNTVSYRAMQAKERLMAKVDREKSAFGIPYVAIANPIFEEGKVVGAITVAISTERYDTLVELGEGIHATIQQVAASTQQLNAQSEELAATTQTMDSETDHTRKDLVSIQTITEEIKEISERSNILGLNASIEAARAGESGRGFSIVAQEIRKLSDNTKKLSTNIGQELKNIGDSVGNLIESIKQVAVVSDNQAAGVSELANAMERLNQMAEQLTAMGKVE